MGLFGFPVKTKSNAGPRIKYFTCELQNAQVAEAMSIFFAENALANNGKLDVNERLIVNTEVDFELAAGASPEDETWITLLLQVISNGELLGSQYLSVPCLKANAINTVRDYMIGKVLVLCDDGQYRACTDAKVVKSTTYAL